ncbi:MAG: BON domain-containing protein [Anaerolineales bacterium]|nr:BON domain-containing protein [Anaerolineales bacterium]
MNKLDLHFHMGAHIHCYDEPCGKLAKVALNKDFLEITHVIVEEGLLLKRARVLPISTIERIEGNDIYVNFHSDQLGNYPEYQERIVEVPITDPIIRPEPTYNFNEVTLAGARPDLGIRTAPKVNRIGIPDELIVIGNSTTIHNLENSIGRLDCVITNKDTFQIKGVVVRQGLIFTDYATLPIDWVEVIENDDIVLKYNNRELHELISTAGLPDEDSVETAEYKPPVSILGHEATVSSQIMHALDADPRTSDAVIEVIHDRGVVMLIGEVDNLEIRQTAEQIATNYPNVVTVVNNLTIR